MIEPKPALTGGARVAGVIGWPVSHSRSPRLHGYWLAKYGIDGAYVPLGVRPDDLAEALSALPKLGFRGVNLTVPHKEAALALVDDVDETAQRIGAVNTVIIDERGRLYGRNTDVFGFMENLRDRAPDWRADRGPAVVLGAGGAARAAVAGLVDAGTEVRIVNRTRARAEALAGNVGGLTVYDWENRADALHGAGLVVNTTTLGMAGKPPLEIDLAPLNDDAVVADIVYTPLETPLLKAARARSLAAVDGLGMLIHQARPGFAAWFGREPEVDGDLRRYLLADLESTA